MNKPIVSASGYLIFRNAPHLQFLLMKHSSRWDLPKGHLDRDETTENAAARELYEETGIAFDQIWKDPDFRFETTYDVHETIIKQVTIFLGWLKEPVAIQATEHAGFEWFDWSPPHSIQTKTIDPLLEQVRQHFLSRPVWPNFKLT